MCANFPDFVFLSVGFEGGCRMILENVSNFSRFRVSQCGFRGLRSLCAELGYRISEYMIRTGFDGAFQISFNISRSVLTLLGC